MYSKNVLEENIYKKLSSQIDNTTMFLNITKQLSKKGLNTMVIPSLMDETKTVSELSDMELIAILQGIFETFNEKEFNPENYFGENTISEYEDYFYQEEKVTELNLKNFTKIDDFNYSGYLSYKDIYLYYTNMLIRYNKKSQRASKLKLIGSNKDIVVREMDINMSSVEEIAMDMINGMYEEDCITLNIRLINEQTVPQFKFTPRFENIGDIKIVPNYDRKSKNYTSVDCIDGMHRIMASVIATRKYKEKTGEWLKGGLLVKLTLRDLKGARRIVGQTFKRSDTDINWLESLNDDDNYKFINELLEKIDILKNTPDTYEEYRAYKTYTYKSILVSYIKNFSGLTNLNSISARKFLTDKIARFISIIVETYKYKYKDLNSIKNNTNLLNSTMFIGYLTIALELNAKNKLDDDIIFKVAESLEELDSKGELDKIVPNKKSVSVKNISDYFINLVKEY